jgi:hypothetical protein
MMKTGFKKLRTIGWTGAFLMANLALLPGAAYAATVASVLASGPATTVQDLGRDGMTMMAIDFQETTGIWLEMDASPAHPDPDEDFLINLVNGTGENITDLWFEVRKPGGEDLGTRPTLADWESSISASQSGGIGISESELVIDQSDRQRIHLKFNPPLSSATGNAMLISLTTMPGFGDWVGFNNAGGNWWLNIDWNVVDDNGPVVEPPPPPPTGNPVPKIMANGSEGPVTLGMGQNLSVTITLDPADYAGASADYWAVASSAKSGWFQYRFPIGWVPMNADFSDVEPAYQGPLVNLSSPLEILSSSKIDMPPDSYEIFFGVDRNMNGSLDLNTLNFDSVHVLIQ